MREVAVGLSKSQSELHGVSSVEAYKDFGSGLAYTKNSPDNQHLSGSVIVFSTREYKGRSVEYRSSISGSIEDAVSSNVLTMKSLRREIGEVGDTEQVGDIDRMTVDRLFVLGGLTNILTPEAISKDLSSIASSRTRAVNPTNWNIGLLASELAVSSNAGDLNRLLGGYDDLIGLLTDRKNDIDRSLIKNLKQQKKLDSWVFQENRAFRNIFLIADNLADKPTKDMINELTAQAGSLRFKFAALNLLAFRRYVEKQDPYSEELYEELITGLNFTAQLPVLAPAFRRVASKKTPDIRLLNEGMTYSLDIFEALTKLRRMDVTGHHTVPYDRLYEYGSLCFEALEVGDVRSARLNAKKSMSIIRYMVMPEDTLDKKAPYYSRVLGNA